MCIFAAFTKQMSDGIINFSNFVKKFYVFRSLFQKLFVSLHLDKYL